jgi:hypothetical protein
LAPRVQNAMVSDSITTAETVGHDPLVGGFALTVVRALIGRMLFKQQPNWRAVAQLIFLALRTPRKRQVRPQAGDWKAPIRAWTLRPLRNARLVDGDHYMRLADLRSYLAADQRLCELYADGDGTGAPVLDPTFRR